MPSTTSRAVLEEIVTCPKLSMAVEATGSMTEELDWKDIYKEEWMMFQ